MPMFTRPGFFFLVVFLFAAFAVLGLVVFFFAAFAVVLVAARLAVFVLVVLRLAAFAVFVLVVSRFAVLALVVLALGVFFLVVFCPFWLARLVWAGCVVLFFSFFAFLPFPLLPATLSPDQFIL